MRRRQLGWDLLARWTSEATAAFAGITRQKGRIAVGCDADLVVFDDQASFQLTSDMVKHKHSVTPYAGRTLSGSVRRTYLRGVQIFDGSSVAAPSGRQITRDK
jgi:allantoinase